MKWTSNRSENVEDRRGLGRKGLAFGGIGSVILAAIVYFMGGDPSFLLNNAGESSGTEQRELSQQEKTVGEFVNMVVAENEITWSQIFAENNMQYQKPRVVLFEEATESGCGVARAAVGPFYCPQDQTVYMDLQFFNELRQRFGAQGGDFAIAYVIGHEIGHHVQTMLGTTDKVNQMRESGKYSEEDMNRVSVAVELQADFFAGVWARKMQDKNVLEAGDIEEAISAAQAVGDDRIQEATQGYAVQESFTHGTSEQRKTWFLKGYSTGDVNQGNTFEQLLR